MNKYVLTLGISLSFFLTYAQGDLLWKTERKAGFDFYYTVQDDSLARVILSDLQESITKVAAYFNTPFKTKFSIHLYPNREALDVKWRQLWNEPGFNSQCWMVASGDTYGLQILSPNVWKKEACEHDPANREEIKKLLMHELVHVFHGQFTLKASLGDLESIGWFVEGIATLASGQLDAVRLEQVKQVVSENKNPVALEEFWSGKARYSQSGYMVAYIEKQKGRKFLFDMLKFTDESSILNNLDTTESNLIEAWKKFVISL